VSLLKKIRKISIIFIISILASNLLAYALLRAPAVQTYLVGKLTNYLSQKLNTVTRIEGVDIEFFSKIVLEGIYVEDLHKDTLLYAGKLKIDIKNILIEKNIVNLKAVMLEECRVNLIQYKNEKDLNFQFIVDAFDSGDTTTTKNKKPLKIFSNQLILKNVDFSYNYQADTSSFAGVNFDHIHLKKVNGTFESIKIINDTINANIKSLSFRDKSGFQVFEMSTNFKISPKEMVCDELKLVTNKSKVKGELKFETNEWDDYNDFEEKVYMRGNFKDTKLNFGDIAYFTSELEGINKFIVFSGKIKGTVANLRGNEMDINFGKNSHLLGDIKMTGLPDFDVTFIQLKLKEFTTCTEDLEGVPLPPFTSKEHFELPPNFYKLGMIKFKGDFTGFQNDFTAYGDLETDLGSVSLDMDLKQNKNELPKYKGNLKSNDFNIGQFYGIENVLTKVTLDIEIDGKGLENETVNATVKGKVNNLICFDYNYNNMSIEGNFAKNIFSGKLEVNDVNLSLKYDGEIDFTNKLPMFYFHTDIGYANLTKLNIIKSSYDRWISTNADFNFEGDDIDNIKGSIVLMNLIYKDSLSTLKYKKIELTALNNGGIKDLILNSDAVDARISGDFKLQELGSDFTNLIAQYLPSAGLKNSASLSKQNFTFELTTKNSEGISNLLVPEMIIKPNSKLNGKFNNFDNTFNLSAQLPEIILFDKKVSKVNITSNSGLNKLGLQMTCNYVAISDSSLIENIALIAAASQDSILFGFDFNNRGKIKNGADLNGNIIFKPGKNIDFFLTKSNITVEDSLWAFAENSKLHIDSLHTDFENFSISHNKQSLTLGSRQTAGNENEITINLHDFTLSNLNPFITSSDIVLGGLLNGNASFSGFGKNIIFSTSLGFIDFNVNNESIGDGNIISLWDSKKESIGLNGNFMRGTLPTIGFTGFYYPNKKENSLDIELQLKKTPLKLFERFLVGVMSDLRGYASGDLFLQGSLKNPLLTGDIEVQRGGFKVDYLNTSYTFNGKAKFVKNDIILQDIVLFDQFGKEAKVSGNMPHNYFSDIKLNINININRFFVLNTTEALNSSYFGKAYATGLINFRGDLNKLIIDVDAKTEPGTQFNIPLSTPEEVSESGFIRFVSKDPNTVVVKDRYKVDFNGIQMSLNLEVTPSAEVLLIFDRKIGDIITGTGSGNIKMDISPLGNFTMYGNYVISKGSYLFTLKNVINKKFKITEGGTINWNGDPFEADINLDAVYKLRTSLNEILVSDSSKRRVPVDCVIKMTDKLMNPTIKFDIKLPQSDERIQNDVRAAINTDNESELNKQMFSLLMLGRFFPPNEAVSSSSLGLSQNTSELLSSQLSNMLSQSNEYVTLGVNVRAGDQTASNEWQASMSTQLFQQRLSIDGNVGVANNPASASNLVGDMSVEYKVTTDGKLRLRAFTQSNDYTNLTTIAPYTQGVGVFYREDFETFNELFKNYSNKLLFFRKDKLTPDDVTPEEKINN
jgi:hypothetical protein